MPKKKKGVEISNEGVPVDTSPETQSVGNLPILAEFDLAERNNQLKRHKSIGSLFDKAAEVIENYLDDPNTDLVSKMFPARLAADIYLAQEKFKREDEKIEIEKRRLVLDELKSGKQIPPGSKFIQNNNYYSSSPQTEKSNPVDIAELKKRQEELLSSYLPNQKEGD